MFEYLIKHYTLEKLNEFNKAMGIIRQGAKNKQQRINALGLQIKYLNLLHHTNFELKGVNSKYDFFMPKTINQLQSYKINKVWDLLKPKYHKINHT